MMRPWSILAAVILSVAVAGLVSACSSKTDPEPPAPLEITQDENGTTQDVQIGQDVRIALDASPTTGYQWGVIGQVPAQLERIGEPQFTPASDAIGAKGTEVWTFVARSAGEGSLKMKYWRSFEPTVPALAKFRVVLRVK
ncbi:MAG TPA: protease inhibitor I42 family protein [Thermoleophilia bacterium]|nr:protease inhibitor I42 family protein [Thermoleophilia bacterium]